MNFKTKNDFKRLFHELYNPLCNFVYKYFNEEGKAEDVVQEVFLQLWEKRDAIIIKGKLANYLFQACKNKSLEILRKQSKEKQHIQDASWVIKENKQDLGREGEEYLKMELLNKSIRQLPPKCQEVFVLHKLNGLTYSEIADYLKLSTKTIENHMVKALKLLRESMIDHKSKGE